MENFFVVPDFMESFTGDPILFVNNPESLPAGLQTKRVGDSITLYWGEILLVKVTLIESYKVRRRFSLPYVMTIDVSRGAIVEYMNSN